MQILAQGRVIFMRSCFSHKLSHLIPTKNVAKYYRPRLCKIYPTDMGIGNNPMVGMTVSTAVSIEEAAKAGKF